MLSATMQFAAMPSLTGLRSLAVPRGVDNDGRSVASDLIGRPFNQRRVFRVRASFRDATGAFHARSATI